MKKIYQRNISQEHGDCYKSALASLLGMEYSDLPQVDPSVPNARWIMHEFLLKRGIYDHRFLWNENTDPSMHPDLSFKRLATLDGFDGLFLGTVASPKYHNPELDAYTNAVGENGHAVVCDKNFNIVFDPNPLYKGLDKYPFADTIGYNGLVYIEVISRNKLEDW